MRNFNVDASNDFISENMPSPSSFKPPDDFDFPLPPSNMVDHKEEVKILLQRKKSEEDIDQEEKEDVEDLEVEEDTFKPIPKYDEKRFGRVGTKKAYVEIIFEEKDLFCR